jgi:PAS domain S-box-containing protein
MNFSREFSFFHQVLFDEAAQPMWMYDTYTLCFIAVNDAAIQHYGYSREEFMQMSIVDIRPPEDIQPLLEVVENINFLDFDTTNTEQWQHVKKDGSVIDVEVHAQSVEYNGRLVRLIRIHDLSIPQEHSPKDVGTFSLHYTLRQAQGEDRINPHAEPVEASSTIIAQVLTTIEDTKPLEETGQQEAPEMAFQQNIMRDNILLQSLLHEAKDPVIAMQGITKSLQYLLGQNEAAKAQEYFPILFHAQTRLSNILHTFTHLQHAETQSLAIRYSLFNATDILAPLLQQQKEEAQEQGVILEYTLPEHSFPMYTDVEYLHGTLYHLLTNILAHSHSGNVVHLRSAKLGKTSAEGESQTFLCLEIQEKESAVSLEQAQRIISSEVLTSHSNTVPTLSSAELGLSIAKDIVARIGGEMFVYANPAPLEPSQALQNNYGLTLVLEIPTNTLMAKAQAVVSEV